MTLRYIGYARKSSEDKNRQVQSIDDQLKWIEQLKTEHSLTIEAIYTDTRSAKTPGRKGFTQLIEHIHRSKEPIGILCWKLDRLSRNSLDEAAIKYPFEKGHIAHIWASDRQYHKGDNLILMGVDFAYATQYSIELSKNVKRGMQSKIDKGWRPCRASLGYLNDPHGLKGKRLIRKDPLRWNTLKKAWAMLLTQTHTVPQIKAWLDQQGLRTRNGKPVALSTLYEHVFQNPFYCGLYRWQGELVEGKHSAMITPAEFEQAQIILGRKTHTKTSKHEHAFTGLIRCADCGCMLTAEPPKVKRNKTNNKVRVYHYMRCSKPRLCSSKCIRVEVLQAQIETYLKSLSIAPAFVRWAKEQLSKDHQKNLQEQSQRIQRLDTQLTAMDDKIATLTDKLISGTLSNDIYQTTLQRYQKEKDDLAWQHAKTGQPQSHWTDKLSDDLDFAQDALKIFTEGNKRTQRHIFSNLGTNYQLNNKTLT